MKRLAMFLSLLAGALAAQSTPGMSQTELTVPGGATGANVFCVQSGNLTTGALVETFLQTDAGAWEQRSKAGTFKLEEKSRDDLVVELFDSSRSVLIQIDFVTMTLREKSSSSAGNWTDGYAILKATDEAASGDCVSTATRNAATDTSGGGADEWDATDEENSSTKAEKPSERSKKAKRPSKRSKKAKSSSKRRKTTKNTSRRRKTRRKQKSGSGLSIGIGGVGIRF